jgi:hypothetical protein
MVHGVDVDVMTVCVTMHNTIEEEEHNDGVYDEGWDF